MTNLTPKTALIIGASGSFGRYVTQALINQGWQVKRLLRDLSKSQSLLQHTNIRDVSGDMFDQASIEKAAINCEAIIFAANLPYEQWQDKALSMIEPALSVCEQNKIRFVLPANVYVYDPNQHTTFEDNDIKQPPSAKGVVRLNMEKRIEKACANGAKALLLRGGDFLGKEAKSSWIEHCISVKKDKVNIKVPGDFDHQHTWAFLPDYANCCAILLSNPKELKNFEQLNFSGHQFSFRMLSQTISQHTKVSLTLFPWWVISMIALVNRPMREITQMRYLWQKPLYLKSKRLDQLMENRFIPSTLEQVVEHCGLTNY